MRRYEFIRNQPVARFFYKGQHTHPVRRTVLIVEQDDHVLTGYELREGMTVRNFSKAPIKSYRKDRIAKINQIDRRRKLRRVAGEVSRTTLQRSPLIDLIKVGA